MNNKTLILFFLVSLFLLNLVTAKQSYAQISVVINKENKTKLTDTDIKNIFSGTQLTWPDGHKVQIADQSSTKTGEDFYNKLLSKSVNEIRKQWTKLILSGQAAAPEKCNNDEEVKKFVTANADAIGFVLSASLDATVVEVYKVE